jgi:hypothetical protein
MISINYRIYDSIRRFISYCIFLWMKLFRMDLKLVGVKHLNKTFKTSDTLFALAPGGSINDYTNNDFKEIREHDSIGINHFILHEYIPTYYVTEPQDIDLGYFDALRAKGEIISEIPILFKGYGSHRKCFLNIANILRVPKYLKHFYAVKDSYIQGKWDMSSPTKIERILSSSKSDYFYNITASLIYVSIFAYKMGYRSVVLCGFDMTDTYFFCNDRKNEAFAKKYHLCEESQSNKLSKEAWRKKYVIGILNDINKKLVSHRNGGIFVYSDQMSLSEMFPTYGAKLSTTKK